MNVPLLTKRLTFVVVLGLAACATTRSPQEAKLDDCRAEVGQKMGWRWDPSVRAWRPGFGTTSHGEVPIHGLREGLLECMYRPTLAAGDRPPSLSGRVTLTGGRYVGVWVWSDGALDGPVIRGAYRTGTGETGEVEVVRESSDYRATFGAGTGRRPCTAAGRIEQGRWSGVYTCESSGISGSFEAFERRL